jgi:hypothetical protein
MTTTRGVSASLLWGQARTLRCAYRNRNNPNNRNNNNGFRVVVSTFLSGFKCPPAMPPGYGWAAEAREMAGSVPGRAYRSAMTDRPGI